MVSVMDTGNGCDEGTKRGEKGERIRDNERGRERERERKERKNGKMREFEISERRDVRSVRLRKSPHEL